jgi:hypothetical protein
MAEWDVVGEAPVAAAAPADPWKPVSEEPWKPVSEAPAAAAPQQGPGAKHPLIDLAVMLGMDPEKARSRFGVASAVLQYPRHFVTSQFDVPKQAFEVSEKLRNEGEFTEEDAGTMANAAMMGGVKLGKTASKAPQGKFASGEGDPWQIKAEAPMEASVVASAVDPQALPMERIDSAAIKVGDKTYTGHTHTDALDRAAKELNITPEDFIRQLEGNDNVGLDGFITTEGRFLSRKEANAFQEKIESGERGIGDNGGPALAAAAAVEPPPAAPVTPALESKIRGLESARQQALQNADQHKFMLDADVETRGYALTPDEVAGYKDAQRSAQMTADSITRSIERLRSEGMPPPKAAKEPLTFEQMKPPPPPVEPPAPRGVGDNGGPALAADQAAVLSRISEQPKPKTDVKKAVTDTYTDLVDDLHPIKKVVKDGVETIDNPYEQFRLTRGSAGKAEHMLRFGTLDYNTLGVNGKPLVETLKPLRNDREAFSAYLLSKRALELQERGIETGVPLAEAGRVAAAGDKKFAAAAKELDTFQENTLKYFKDSGIISQEAFDGMRAASKSYIPLYRAFEPQGSTTGKRFNVFNPIRKLVGANEKILDPIDSIIRNNYVLTEMAERNRAATTLIKYARENPDALPMQKVSQQAKPIDITPNEITRMMEDNGIGPEVYGGTPSEFTIWRKGQADALKPDEFAVYENGKRTVYKTNPEIATAVRGMDEQELGLFTRVAAAPARLLRAGVTLDPAYMGSNIIRDQLSAAVQSKSNYRPGVDAMRGLWSKLRKDEAYQDWLKSGGSQSTLVSQDRARVTDFLREYGSPPDVMQAIKNAGGSPIRVLRDLSETVDNATRIGEFKRATKGERSPEAVMKGGMAARDVTQDFQRRGAKVRAWNAVSAFANGQVQGLDREIMNFKSRPIAASAKIASYITLPTIYFWVANRDDERYKNAPRDIKDQYWLYLPEDKNAEPIKIPKGFTTGLAGGSLIERTLEAYFSDKPEAYKGFVKNLLGSMVPNIIPTIAKPVIEQFGNRSTFFQTPLVGDKQKRLPNPEQANRNTSETAKLVGKGLSKAGLEDYSISSPIILDNYIRSWGGKVADYATKGSDAALKTLGAVEAGPPGPNRKLSDIPIISRFVMKYPSASAQPIQDFYEKYNEAEKKFNSAREARRRDGDAAPDLPARLLGPKKQLDALHKVIRETYADKDMSGAEKRKVIDETYIEMLQVAQEALAAKGYGGP